MIRKPNEISFATISLFRKIAGLVLGLFYAVILFAFQVVLRDLLRLGSTSEFNEMWLISDDELAFYNWFAAALALMIGQSVCLGFWFSRPRRLNDGGMRVRSAILNDQFALQGNFLMWFLKLGFTFGIFFGLVAPSNQLEFSFYRSDGFIALLVIFVLFFQSWKSISLKARGKLKNWMPIAFLILGVCSWDLSKIVVVDFKGVSERILKENIWYSHDLQLPKVYYAGDFDQNYQPVQSLIFFRISEDTSTIGVQWDGHSQTYIDRNNAPISLFESNSKTIDFLNTCFRFYIDKRIQMKTVHVILEDCRKHDIQYISYAMLPIDSKLPPAAHHGFQINHLFQMENVLKDTLTTDSLSNQINVEHLKSGTYIINGRDIPHYEVQNELLTLLMLKTYSTVNYTYSEELAFEDYIQFNVEISKAMHQFRDFYSWYENLQAYDDLHENLKSKFDSNYPIRLRQYMKVGVE